ncbi:hypothetical protein EJF36_18585 [Bacillus sp. HMF5848]|uniref:hypothetical protein n=1 Tax=Bacillus sp. HMF5848 TaxID=2495421 RepID=UPI000F79F61F|nr:hypothetical protein [Bacillus sp. HMF5848]RSK28715.1 hypothetical protein EJF36_18585 [Bacillus sp. HMF5848]
MTSKHLESYIQKLQQQVNEVEFENNEISISIPFVPSPHVRQMLTDKELINKIILEQLYEKLEAAKRISQNS